MTPAETPAGHASPPLLHKNPNISETIQITTPKPYIFFFLMLRRIEWHWQGPPWGHDAPPSLHLRPYISETIQIPTPKPYRFLFPILRCIQWHQPGSPWGHATIPSLYKRPVNTGRGLCIALQYYCILLFLSSFYLPVYNYKECLGVVLPVWLCSQALQQRFTWCPVLVPSRWCWVNYQCRGVLLI